MAGMNRAMPHVLCFSPKNSAPLDCTHYSPVRMLFVMPLNAP
jgi:hypothetical protein